MFSLSFLYSKQIARVSSILCKHLHALCWYLMCLVWWRPRVWMCVSTADHNKQHVTRYSESGYHTTTLYICNHVVWLNCTLVSIHIYWLSLGTLIPSTYLGTWSAFLTRIERSDDWVFIFPRSGSAGNIYIADSCTASPECANASVAQVMCFRSAPCCLYKVAYSCLQFNSTRIQCKTFFWRLWIRHSVYRA